MDYKYVSIDRIFAKMSRDLGEDFIEESNVIEWAGEALEFIGAVKFYEEAVAFIEIKNHQCVLPAGMHAVIQIARNNRWSKNINDNPFCPKRVVEELVVESPFIEPDDDCSTCGGKSVVPDWILLDCNGQPLNDYDVAYYRPYFDFKYGYNVFSQSSFYRSNFTPVRLKTNSFFNELVCKEQGHVNYGPDEYTIVQGKIARFNFQEGGVAVAYLRQVMDAETGYPMIPDNISYTTAIVKYITMRIMEKQFYAGRDGAKMKLEKAEMDWQWYCKQAGNIDMMPYGIDEHQNLLDQRSYLLPNNNKYYGFFGNLAQPESKRYNNPDYRGKSNSYR